MKQRDDEEYLCGPYSAFACLASRFSADQLLQVMSWKVKLPLQTIMRLLQVLVPQVEKICIDK